MNIVATGRDAPAALVDVADTVTEMRKVKHAYDAGHRGQEGHRLLSPSPRCTRRRPVLVWRFDRAARSRSRRRAVGGGIGAAVVGPQRAGAARLRRAPISTRTSPRSRPRAAARGDGVGHAHRGADVDRRGDASDGGVEVCATVGVAHADVGRGRRRRACDAWAPGTINIVAFVPARLSRRPRSSNAVDDRRPRPRRRRSLERGVPGTGTASDAVCIVCPAGGHGRAVRRAAFARRGARCARAVHEPRSRGRHLVITLVLGGTRSGKSEVAERLARRAARRSRTSRPADATDAEFAARIAAHRARRPAVVGDGRAAGRPRRGTLDALAGTVLVDSLGTWVARRRGFAADVEGTARARSARGAGTPCSSPRRSGWACTRRRRSVCRFADALGECNRRVAASGRPGAARRRGPRPRAPRGTDLEP